MTKQHYLQLAIALALQKKQYETKEGNISTNDFVQRLKEKLNSSTQEGSSYILQLKQNITDTNFLDSQLPPSPDDCTLETQNTVFLNTQELLNETPLVNIDDNVEPPVELEPKIKDFKEDYSEIRKAILRMNKQSSLTFQSTKKKLLSIFDMLYLHSEKRSKFVESNMLSSAFLKLMTKVFEIPLLNDKHIHEIFKIIINCYLINFNNFVTGIRTQFKIIFQFTFDILSINAKPVKNYGQSFLRKLADHKTKTQLTQIDNKNYFQILLYYLVQLIFLLIQSPHFKQKDIFYAEEQLRKLLAFLIINENNELLRIFHKSRLKLKHKLKLN